MSAAEALRVGWCPGALRPMPSGDGLLVRVKPPAATLTPAQAHGLADAASTHGNGIIELTQRGNLQIRGLRADTIAAFAAAVRGGGLALPPAQERRRPVMPPPLLGADPAIHPAAAALVAALEQTCATLADLPGKFAIHVDGGGVLGGRPAAASLVARPDGTLLPGGPMDAPVPAGPLRYGDGRMAFALAPPFAEFDARMLHGLADLAGRHATTIRVTPWRALLLASVDAGQEIAAQTSPAWITDPADPRLRIVACIGAPGCGSGTTATRKDAGRQLLPPVGAGRGEGAGVLHISGCPKGCAHPGPAALTLVAIDGRYHAVHNGRAQDAVAGAPPDVSMGATA